MKQLILLALISILSAILGIGLTKDPGYILVVFHHWQIETTLFLAGLILIILTLGFIFSFHLLKDIFSIPYAMIKRFQQWRRYRAERGLNQGLQAFYQGKWRLALKNIRAQEHYSTWATDLIAAEAAQKDNAYPDRDALIKHALDSHPEAKESILLFQTKLQLEQGQLEQAQATLKTIGQIFKEPTYQWVHLQLKVHHDLKEFEAGLKLLESQKHSFKNKQEYLNQYLAFFVPLLNEYLQKNQLEQGLEVYKKLPKDLQNNIEILKIIAPAFPENRKIQNHIEKQLLENVNNDILELISTLPPSTYWFNKLEKIRSEHTNNAMLYYTFGKIESGLKLWGSAIADLQKSLEIHPRYQTYTLLAQIYMDLDEPNNALKALQKAIECPTHEQ